MEQQDHVRTISDQLVRVTEFALDGAWKQRMFAPKTAVSAPGRRPECDTPGDRTAGDRTPSEFRGLALSWDASHGRGFELSELWFGLCSGRVQLRETFASERRYYAVIDERAAGSRVALSARSLEILTRVLLGESQKVLAVDLGLARSTITSSIQAALRVMGVPCTGSRAPALLTMVAHSARRPSGGRAIGRRCQVVTGGPATERQWVVSVERPDLDLPAQLSHAERAVVRALVAGCSHAEICSMRATSPRTVANQLATAFRKLGVSGRGELLNLLVTHCSDAQLKERDERTGSHEPVIYGAAPAGAA